MEGSESDWDLEALDGLRDTPSSHDLLGDGHPPQGQSFAEAFNSRCTLRAKEQVAQISASKSSIGAGGIDMRQWHLEGVVRGALSFRDQVQRSRKSTSDGAGMTTGEAAHASVRHAQVAVSGALRSIVNGCAEKQVPLPDLHLLICFFRTVHQTAEMPKTSAAYDPGSAKEASPN